MDIFEGTEQIQQPVIARRCPACASSSPDLHVHQFRGPPTVAGLVLVVRLSANRPSLLSHGGDS
ncbi:MAG: hypothetical protein R2690_04045 [Acidimicrobiales bacterium]